MSEKLGQKNITIPWTDGLKLGNGFRQFERAIASRSAVKPFGVKASAAPSKEVSFRSMTITNQQSMCQQIKNSLKVETPVYGFPIRVEASFLNTAEYSDTRMTTFIEMAIKEKPCMYREVPSLTKEAADILAKEPSEFRKHFGEYFVGGYVAQSTLVATFVFKAENTESLNSFKLEAGADINPASVEAMVSLSNKAQKMGISTSISTHVVGLTMTPEQKRLNIDEIESTLQDFKRNHKPREHTAILVSFATLNLKAAPHGNTSRVFDGIEDCFKDIFKLLDSVRHAPNPRARKDMEEKVFIHAEKLQKLLLQGDVGPTLEAWKRTYEELAREYTVWQERQKVLDDPHLELTQYLWPGQASSTSTSEWMAADSQAEWSRGKCWLPAGSRIAGELISQSIPYNPSWTAGANNSGDLTIHGGDRIIVGYKVNSHWQDGTNGYWQMVFATPERVTVRFRSAEWRGCSWTLTVCMVPRNIYSGY